MPVDGTIVIGLDVDPWREVCLVRNFYTQPDPLLVYDCATVQELREMLSRRRRANN